MGLPGLVFANSQRLCRHFGVPEVLIFQEAAAVLSHSQVKVLQSLHFCHCYIAHVLKVYAAK